MGTPHDTVQHVQKVMNLVDEFPRVPAQLDRPVAYSWLRCAKEHRMRPDSARDTAVLENHHLRERQQRLDDLVMIARAEMDSLYEQISGSGYALLLTDTSGVILSSKVDPVLKNAFRNAGLVTGADWSEAHEGTNGIGTCITERRPITIHRHDHFRTSHIELSCSAAPIRNPAGDLAAVLDASCVGSDDSKASRMHTVALVTMSARLIEKSLFLRRYRDHAIVRFHSRPEFVNLLHDGALAVTEDGRVVAADDTAVALLTADERNDLIGRTLYELFDARERDLLDTRITAQRQTILPLRDIAHGRRYFASIQPPQREQRPASRSERNGSQVLTIEPQTSENRWHTLEELAGNDPTMQRNLRCAQRIATSRVSVLIHGTTGSGKEVFARALHMASDRATQPFVAVNCAAIPESLIESELFGYKPGAFTGARREGMRGRLMQSSGGTLFLDEIGDMPLLLQTRLLRVLEEQEVTPLGGETPQRVDLRVISASHRNLREMIERGQFREDLYYRLNGITMELPSLRERQDLENVIRRVFAEESVGRPAGLEVEAMRHLLAHAWPGNIRELRNVIRTALAISEGGIVRVADLPADVTRPQIHAVPSLSAPAHESAPGTAGNPLEQAERSALMQAIHANRWNMTHTAQQLNMSRNTLYRKLKHHGISAKALRSDELSQR